MEAKRLIVFTLLAILLLSTFACGGGEEEAGATPTPAATPTPTPTATPTGVLFSDDFSDETSGWDTFADENGQVSYEGGWLHISNYTAAEFDTYSFCHEHFTDFILEVETKLVAGTDDNSHGIACRIVDENNYYAFTISADGFYGIAAWTQGSAENLVEWTRSIHIRQGRDVINLVRVECVGSTLRLSVNGNLLREVTDSRLRSGSIALFATSWGDTFTEIAFDNIVVTAP